MQQDPRRKNPKEVEFFTEYGESNRYKILEIIGKGSYGVVCSAVDTHTGEKVAIKKITDIFEHASDAVRILREIKLLRLLRHPDIVEIKRIMLPPSRRAFKDIFVVFELMESDLHQVIKANDDLTHEHHRFFLYQMLRALKYMHTANVYHRDLKPKNILANANCKLKICDFGLARVAFNDAPTAVLWTDYVATRWYRAPELCGSFSSKYTPAIDIWSIGCIFAEVLTGRPLFPGKSVVHQLELITDLLGTPSADIISGVRNDKARKYLMDMRKKQPVPFSQKFVNVDPFALRLLQRLLAFDPKDRPTAEEALADPYFKGLAKLEREPSCQSISKLEFEFERRRVTKEDIRELIFWEILEYHPQLLKDHMAGNESTNFLYPSAIGQFRRQFAYLEENSGKNGPVMPPERKHVSLPRSSVNSGMIASRPQQNVVAFDNRRVMETAISGGRVIDTSVNVYKAAAAAAVTRPPPRMPTAKQGRIIGPVLPYEEVYDPRVVVKNAVAPPVALPPQYVYMTTNGGDEGNIHTTEASRDSSSVPHPHPHPQTYPYPHPHPQVVGAAKLSGGIVIDLNSNMYYSQTHAHSHVNPHGMASQQSSSERIAIAQTQFGHVAGVAAAAAAHTVVQIGLS
ncbi:mitogen-activated protein kinase 15-like [Cynara cardunculus var. scolymus]|uniref:mitogen-activated protein kinase 15-like n=1 Tax=Cynara cardunculus var. scolymus TaxID=59895 RepID=UPI000D623C4B|nr:mitogen-activated protein kinase 15-like [Cynara cardunculus var. scolymus]